MTEAVWPAWDDPDAMIRSVTNYFSSRRERLFAAACCRRMDCGLGDLCRNLIERVESLADRPLSSVAHNELVHDAMAHAD